MRRDPNFSIGFAGGGGDDALEILIHVFPVLSFTFFKEKNRLCGERMSIFEEPSDKNQTQLNLKVHI